VADWRVLDKLSQSELRDIEAILKGLKSSDPNNIKSEGIRNYVNNAIGTNGDVFHIQCYIIAIVSFLNSKGYVLTKKEGSHGK